jgi:hypothetical protein
VRVAAHLLSREHACPRTLFFGVATGAGPPGETRGGKSWFQHGRPHSGRGGCLGGVARPDGGVKFVFFPWRGHAFTTGRKTYKLHSLLIKL